MVTSRFWSRIIRTLPRKIPAVLTVASVAGVVATGVLSAYGQFKADKVLAAHAADLKYMSTGEKIALTWRHYVPAALAGVGTCAAVVTAEAMNKHYIAAITGAAAATSRLFTKYRQAVKETVDEKTFDAIEDEMELSAVSDATPFTYGVEDDFRDVMGRGDTLFFESQSKRFFKSTIEKVQAAEYHLNRNYILRGWVNLNEFYDFLGLDKTDIGEHLGWSDEVAMDMGYSWIDFDHTSSQTAKGTPFYIIRYPFEPVFIPDW